MKRQGDEEDKEPLEVMLHALATSLASEAELGKAKGGFCPEQKRSASGAVLRQHTHPGLDASFWADLSRRYGHGRDWR
jgi:hypothetical protein